MRRRSETSDCCDSIGCASECCVEVQSIKARPLLDEKERRRLANLFKVMANQTRLHLLHIIIRAGEISVNALADTMEMTPQAVSNQLQKLLAQQIVDTRREGNSILYHVVDPCTTILLDYGLCLLEYKRRKTKPKRRSL